MEKVYPRSLKNIWILEIASLFPNLYKWEDLIELDGLELQKIHELLNLGFTKGEIELLKTYELESIKNTLKHFSMSDIIEYIKSKSTAYISEDDSIIDDGFEVIDLDLDEYESDQIGYVKEISIKEFRKKAIEKFKHSKDWISPPEKFLKKIKNTIIRLIKYIKQSKHWKLKFKKIS